MVECSGNQFRVQDTKIMQTNEQNYTVVVLVQDRSYHFYLTIIQV